MQTSSIFITCIVAGDAFGHVSLCVCLSVCLVEGLDVETSFFGIQGHLQYFKLVYQGCWSRSRSQESYERNYERN